MQVKQTKESIKILTNWRGYTTTIKKRTPFYCKIEMFNVGDNHFIMVYSLNDKGLSIKEINENIYKSIEKNGSKASTMQIQTFVLEIGIIAKQWLRKVGVKIEVVK